ncbi:hypothetical protein [Methylobacterium sp. Leaf85]|uniref:hypothetical protein n=1 Tax=Methylobacterium sp. Leaf85 TaxID=1736241 RepID=UPI0006F2DFD5|nr:hypothetical protein [Methylobacterium sp. Leaf85]KQO52219.1 hypothetical protein ASF08_21735 [Methylobacterium sp. Leaf85]
MRPLTLSLLLVSGIGALAAAPAGAGSVESYMAANGGCGLLRERLGREIASPQPFGRPMSAWTESDVDELEDIGLSCVAGPPPVMPGSPGARFKQATAAFRRGVVEARRHALVDDGDRDVDERIAESQGRDRSIRDRDSAQNEREYAEVNANQDRQRRQAEAGLRERQAAIRAQQTEFQTQEQRRREQDVASGQETARRTQQMVAERATAGQQAEAQARELVERARSLLSRAKGNATAEIISEIALLRSQIRAIQNQTRGELGSDLFGLDTDLIDASTEIKQQLEAHQRQRQAPAGGGGERSGPGSQPTRVASPVDDLIVSVRPGISEFGGLTVGGLRDCLSKKPGERTVTIREDGHRSRYVIRTENKADVSWAEFVVIASGNQAHIPEVRGYSAEYRNPFNERDWRFAMAMVAGACSS